MAYDWKNISPQDSFQVMQGHLLSLEEEKSLQFLYLPIMGSQAYSLFLYLNHLRPPSQNRPHYLKDLFSILNMGIQDFFQARVRLEALDLLKSYYADHHYIFQLKEALNGQSFLDDDILRHLLVQQVGQSTYDYILSQLKCESIDLGGYEDISRRFIDVFPLAVKTKSSDDQEDYQLNLAVSAGPPQIKEKESDFEWSVFEESLRSSYVKASQVNDPAFKSCILFLHQCYGIDELDMSRLVVKLADLNTAEVDLKKLTAYVRHHYPITASQNVKDLVEEGQANQPPVKQGPTSPASKEDQALIQASLDNSPIEFLTSIKDQMGGFVSSKERYLVENLVDQSKLPPSVINILLHYIMVVKGNHYLHENFVNQIANDWAVKGIDSPQSALQAARDFVSQRKPPRAKSYPGKKRGSTPKKSLPHWVDQADYQDQPLQQENSKSLQDRIQALRKKADQEGD